MLSKMKQILEKAYWAGVALPPTGTSLDYRTMEIEIEKLLPEVMEILDVLASAEGYIQYLNTTWDTMRAERNKYLTRATQLSSVVKDLLEQHERQIDMENCGRRCSYPSKFPEWDRAWENARKVLDG